MARRRALSTAALAATAALVVSAAPAHAANPSYVALGDSYSSGTGTRSYISDGTSCLRSVYAYPSLIASAKGYDLNFRACSGAKIADVSNTQLSALSSSTAYVSISIGGNEIVLKSPTDAIDAGVGMVFQHFMLADNLTVLENMVLGAEKLHGIGDDARAEIRRISDRFGFDLEPDTLVEKLGVAARQRLEIAKVLYRGAKIIILDEPTAVLVPQEVDALFANLRELRDAG